MILWYYLTNKVCYFSYIQCVRNVSICFRFMLVFFFINSLEWPAEIADKQTDRQAGVDRVRQKITLVTRTEAVMADVLI